jgi:hypothetical protein
MMKNMLSLLVFHLNPIPEIYQRSTFDDPVGIRLLLDHRRSSDRRNSEVKTLFPGRRDYSSNLCSSYINNLYPSGFAPNSQLIAPANLDMVLCFLAGVAIYQYREMIPHSAAMAFLVLWRVTPS